MRAKGLRRGNNGPVKSFVRCLEITLGKMIGAKVRQDAHVLRIELRGLFEIFRRFLPFTLPTLNRPDGHVGFGVR